MRNLTDGTGTVTLYAVWRQPLSEIQKPYLTQLEEAFQALASATEGTLPYTSEDWDSLSAAYTQAVDNIKGAQEKPAMQTALDKGIAAMEAVPTARERIDHVVDSWESAHSEALAYLSGGKLTQANAAQAHSLASRPWRVPGRATWPSTAPWREKRTRTWCWERRPPRSSPR